MINPDEYMLVPEAAQKWGLSCGRVNILLWDGRIEGAMKLGRQWVIPKNAEKPRDRRYTKQAEKRKMILEGMKFCPTCGGRMMDTDKLERVDISEYVNKYKYKKDKDKD